MRFVQFSGNLLNNPDTGFFAKNGNDVLETRKETIDRLEMARRRIEGDLGGDPEALRMFRENAIIRQNNFNKGINLHTIRTERDLNDQVSQARIGQQMEIAGNNFQNEALINDAIKTGVDELIQRAEFGGWEPELLETEVRNFVSGMHAVVLDRLVVDNPLLAKAYLEKNGHMLVSKHQTAADKLVKLSVDEQMGLLVERKHFDPARTEAEILDAIREDPAVKDDPDALDKALSRARAHYADIKRSTRDSYEKYRDATTSRLLGDENSTRDDVPLNLDIRDRNALIGAIEQRITATQQKTFARLFQMAESARDSPEALEAFASENILLHEKALGPALYKVIVKLWESAKQDRKDRKLTASSIFLSRKAQAVTALRKAVPSMTRDEEDEYLVKLARAEIAELEHLKKPDGKLDAKEFIAMLDLQTTSFITDKNFFSDERQLLMDITSETQIVDVPGDAAVWIREFYRRKSASDDGMEREPSPDQVRNMYLNTLLMLKRREISSVPWMETRNRSSTPRLRFSVSSQPGGSIGDRKLRIDYLGAGE